MELITAHTLWKDYNLKILPLNETVLKTDVTEKYSVKHVYFNGEATGDGVTRIYARLYSPACIPTGASVVLMNDVDDPFDTTFIDVLTDCGYTVLALDYAGKRDGDGKFTIYPESLSAANWFSENGGAKKITANPKLSCWYVYATVMLRGYTYLESQPDLDKTKISFFGVRRGAFQVYKAAFVRPDAACAIALFNSSYVEGLDLNSVDAMSYNTCLSNNIYAPLLTVPTYILESSNNRENSLFTTGALYSTASESCNLFIAEHSDNTLTSVQLNSLIAFINGVCFSHSELPKAAELNAVNSDRALYYEIYLPNPEDAEEVNLFYSHGDVGGAYRYWSKPALERVSENEYICKADVYVLKDETSAFVNVRYKNGIILSSEIITKIPYMMGVSAKEIVKSRLVYDTDMGTDDWLIMNASVGKSYELSISTGGNGISGITSSANTLSTLKIGDENTSGERDSLLQLLVYSFSLQTLTITVTCKNEHGTSSYSALKRPEAYEEWTKITLSASEFKSHDGPMQGWDKAVCITISGEDKLLVNSLLWI